MLKKQLSLYGQLLFGFYASEASIESLPCEERWPRKAQAGRALTGLPQPPVPPLNSFHTVFHSDVENSYFSTVHNRLYMGQK